MSNEIFTQLPTTSAATMADSICAVQGYVSPSSPGLSVQETLQQVYNLFQANVILSNAGNPNSAVAGSTYQLCWDTTNMILYVCTTTGSSGSAVWTKVIALTAGSGITISQAGNNITISTNAFGDTFVTVTTATQQMLTNHAYYVTYTSGCTLTLPTTASAGDFLYVLGKGTNGWTIAQNALQSIQVGSSSTTVGIGGSLASTSATDSLTLMCVVSNTTWQVSGAPQSLGLTIV